MRDNYKILGVSGSLRDGSYNTGLLNAAKDIAPENVEIEVYIPNDLPLFSQDLENDPPQVVKDFKSKIENADGLIFASPEQNFTISATMKNAIEWGDRPYGDNSFFNKPAAIMGATTSGFGTVRAQNHMRQIFQDLSVITFHWPTVTVSRAKEKFDNGVLVDEHIKEKIRTLIEHLVELIEFLPEENLIFTTK